MPQTDSDEEVPFVPLRRGDEIKVKILQFGPLGASASVNDNAARGLILQSEVQYAEKRRTEGDIKVGEHLTGYVERVREDGKVDIALRPVDVLRIEVLKNEVLATLKASVNGTIEVGDKSPPERIAKIMNGMSKTDFKNAVGALYKEGLVRPSKLWVKLIAPEDLEESKRKARKALEFQILMREAEKKEQYRLDKLNQLKQKGEQAGSDNEEEPEEGKRERNEECCLFVGNLPPNIEPKLFVHAVQSKILPENIVNIRLCRDQNGLSRGFGYVELVNESLVEASIEILKGHLVGGRKLRVDYANPEKRYIVKARSERDFGPDSEEARRRRGSDVLPARARRGLLSDRSVSQGNDNRADGTSSAAKVGDWTPRYASSLPQDVAKPSRHHPSYDNYFDTPTRPSGPRTRVGHVDPTKPAFEATLYFGNLPFDATKEDLQQEILNSKCIRAEDIASARIILDRETGLSKGYGYVDLYTAEAAEKIYDELHNHEFRGRPMKIDDATR